MLTQATDIFFEASATKVFASGAEKQSFHLRWFGRYAEELPDTFLLALDGDGRVLGYLAGCTDSFSENAVKIISDISYFTPEFCAAMKAYPSHFHINVSHSHRGHGLGHVLTAHFTGLCRQLNSPGIHIVTGAASRAARFYETCGFRRIELGAAGNVAHAVMVYPLAST